MPTCSLAGAMSSYTMQPLSGQAPQTGTETDRNHLVSSVGCCSTPNRDVQQIGVVESRF